MYYKWYRSTSALPEGFKPSESCLKVIKRHFGESICARGRKEYQQFEKHEEAPSEEPCGYDGSYDFPEPGFQTQYVLPQFNITVEEGEEEEAEELTREGEASLSEEEAVKKAHQEKAIATTKAGVVYVPSALELTSAIQSSSELVLSVSSTALLDIQASTTQPSVAVVSYATVASPALLLLQKWLNRL
ncbi:uncharacterized protein A4U43_C05F26170 [Asparagus officinalis]|uniref:Uncharacterized protein n=1 Tax=Asparagus officinalis TaxID=4686 RepID=A0A5P1EUL1_ASPOF|nr:uncharacterized protein A4U43_C05F26170 [Asparagus officinalis]